MDTKQKILNVALDLFSKNGYEATSMSMIAEKVGIKKASLYAHYNNKQDILDSLILFISKQYEDNSLFSNTDFKKINIFKSAKDLSNQVKKQVSYIIHNPYVSKVRKLFTIDQFRNEQLSALKTKYSYTNVLDFGNKLMEHLIENDVLIKQDTLVMASQFVFPISMWIERCDREKEFESEAMKLIEKHVVQFYKIYQK